MFGYIVPSLENVQPDERARYEAAYCGLCRALGDRCGQRCRLALSYDMTFLSLLLDSLYEPDERAGQGRCLVHPAKPRSFVRTDCTDYAADMTVALAYHKCLDDWNDDRSVRGRAAAAALAGPYRAVQQRHPRTCAVIEANMKAIGAIEQAAAAGGAAAAADDPDAAANCFGILLGEVFAWRDDFWADDLRRFGARLGKFVYVMDAAMDFDDDKRTGSYNPLVALGASPEDMKEDLEMLASGAAEAFERLPLERDLHLLRSVLYAGVWQQYYARDAKDAGARAGDAVGADAERGADADSDEREVRRG